MSRSIPLVCLPGLLTPSMPFPPQAPQGPMAFGQPRPPLMGYVGQPWLLFLLNSTRKMYQDQHNTIPFQQVPRLILPTSTVGEVEELAEAAGEIMTTSEDKEATSASRATSGERAAVNVVCTWLWCVNSEGHVCPSHIISECLGATPATSLSIVTWMRPMTWTSSKNICQSPHTAPCFVLLSLCSN